MEKKTLKKGDDINVKDYITVTTKETHQSKEQQEDEGLYIVDINETESKKLAFSVLRYLRSKTGLQLFKQLQIKTAAGEDLTLISQAFICLYEAEGDFLQAFKSLKNYINKEYYKPLLKYQNENLLNSFNVFDVTSVEACSNVMVDIFCQLLKDEDVTILKLTIAGYSQLEISERINKSRSFVFWRLGKIKQLYIDYIKDC